MKNFCLIICCVIIHFSFHNCCIAMQYISIKNCTEQRMKLKKFYLDHSYARAINSSEVDKGGIIKIGFITRRSENTGDGVCIEITDVSSKKSELKLYWDYEDRYDYYPKPVPSDGNFVIVRAESPNKYVFDVVTKQQAQGMAFDLITKGESLEAVKEQIGLDRIFDVYQQVKP